MENLGLKIENILLKFLYLSAIQNFEKHILLYSGLTTKIFQIWSWAFLIHRTCLMCLAYFGKDGVNLIQMWDERHIKTVCMLPKCHGNWATYMYVAQMPWQLGNLCVSWPVAWKLVICGKWNRIIDYRLRKACNKGDMKWWWNWPGCHIRNERHMNLCVCWPNAMANGQPTYLLMDAIGISHVWDERHVNLNGGCPNAMAIGQPMCMLTKCIESSDMYDTMAIGQPACMLTSS